MRLYVLFGEVMGSTKINGLSLDAYVLDKITRYNKTSKDFDSLFEFMFSEKECVMYERIVGFKIVKTTYGESYSNILGKTTTIKKMLSTVPKGSVIGLAMDNSIDWIENFWAILRAGYNPLLVNLRLSDEVLAKVFNELDVRAVISDKKTYSVKTIISATIVPDSEHIKVSPEDYGIEMYVMSSGTTDNVKCCAYSSEELSNQVNDSYNIIKSNKQVKKHFNDSLKHLVVLPFYHIYGFAAVYLWFGFFSRTFVHLNDMSSQTVVNTIRKHEVTHIFAVPMFWNRIYEQAMKTIEGRGEKTFNKFNKALALSIKLNDNKALANAFRKVAFKEVRENLFGDSISFMITGGSDIIPEVLKFFNGIGYILTNGYGMSEIGITSVELSTKNAYLNTGSVGQPLTSNKYMIDENGILLVNSVSSARSIIVGGVRKDRDEWFNTNDLVREVNGHYYIDGRRDDLVIGESGENLNPVIIESQIKLDNAKEVCLVKLHSKPALVVSVPALITEAEFECLKSNLAARLKEINLDNQLNKIIYTTDELTNETQFKLNRGRIGKLCANNELKLVSFKEEAKNELLSELEKEIKTIFAECINKSVDDFNMNDDFYTELGGTSLDFFNACAIIVEKFKLNVTVEECADFRTAAEFCNLVKDKMNNV